jgi:hypothetical protein
MTTMMMIAMIALENLKALIYLYTQEKRNNSAIYSLLVT